MSVDPTRRDLVRERYAQAAVAPGGCCHDPITASLYTAELEGLPQAAVEKSLGCANPHLLARLQPGEHVLDLGSGAGLDVLISARRVGPEGFAYGLDMTDEMLEAAERNRAEAGLENVRFLKGFIEDVPLPDGSVDVVLSNCVINLSTDKPRVLREAFRVLRPGGRLAVADVVTDGPLPTAVAADLLGAIGCVSGALEVREYVRLLELAGFERASVEPFRRYSWSDVEPLLSPSTADSVGEAERAALEGRVMGALVQAFKPGS
jgi:ubiquinone/menaquinone biosynthesis C-methylase UbiE